MKPRNDREREVVRLSAALPSINTAQWQYAADHCFEKVAYISGEAWCSHCGGIFSPYEHTSPLEVSINGVVVCPHCGTRLTAKNSRKRKLSERWYYTILTTAGGWQVCRHFIAEKAICKGGQAYIRIDEAVQNWINQDGKEVIIARPCKPMIRVYDAWDFSKPMEVRSCRGWGYYTGNKYEIHSEYIYPQRGVLRLLRRNGYRRRVEIMPPSALMKLLLCDREAEMLAKTDQLSLLSYKWAHMSDAGLRYPHAIKIAIRHGYYVKDASMWYDYLYLLDYFNLDTHNPHYICPANLKEEHDKLSLRRQRIEARMAAEEKRKQAAKYEAKYRKDKGAYFGVCFGNDDIQISVISSVADMAEEGTVMHHCVYASQYFLKRDSLILTARSATDGKRIETIEISLKTFEVVQSRAKCNGVSEYHDEILRLVRNNIDAIRQIKSAA